jgi:hypothetical protein
MNKFILFVCLSVLFVIDTSAQNFVWTNGNATNSWDDADNWDQVAVPTAGDAVVFDGGISNDDCFIGGASEGLSLVFQNNYTGTVEIGNGASLTIYGQVNLQTAATILVNGDFAMGFLTASAGTFNAGGATSVTISVDYGGTATTGGGFTISGCTFTAPSTGALLVTGTISNLTAGSFNANGGTFFFSPKISKSIGSGYTGSNAFNNLTMETTGSGVVTSTINAGGVTVNGNLTLVTSGTKTFVLNTGNINVMKNLDVSGNLATNGTASNNSGGTATITLAGSTAQNIIGNSIGSSGGNLPSVVISQTGGGSISLSDRINFARNLTINSNGSITTNTSTVAFQGTTTTSTLSGTTTNNVPFYNLTVNKSTTSFSISSLSASWVTISNLLTVSAGTCNTGNKLAFLSTAANTSAQLAAVTGTVSGTVRVERFIPGSTGRKWRFLASPVTTSDFISNNWQQQIHITGSGTGGTTCPSLTANSNGFDATTQNTPSFYTYSESGNAWSSIASTSGVNLTPGAGYRVFIRGNRSQGCSLLDGTNPTPNNVTLSATGTLATGTQTINVTSGAGSGWNLVGNPFQAIIDWDNIARSSVGTTYYIFNPNAGLGGAGAYGNYTAGGSGTNGASRYIGPGHSFWVQASGAGSITIEEADKAVTQTGSATTVFKTSVQNGISIKILDAQNFSDEVLVTFNNSATKCADASIDAEKLQFNVGVGNIATFNTCSSTRYAINSMPEYTSSSQDTIGVHIKVPSNTSANYRLSFDGLASIPSNLDVYLIDQYTSTYYNLRNNSVYNFSTIANNVATQGANRFSIIIGSGLSALPVKLINFTAARNGNNAKLSWSTASEINSKLFVVERSLDASTFEEIGVVGAKGNSSVLASYNFNDFTPVLGANNYYRLKAVDKDGKFEYSNIQIVSFDENTEKNISIATNVYPMPADDHVNLTIGQDVSGDITYTVYDVAGNVVSEAVNMPVQANGELRINLNPSLIGGFYIIELTDDFGNTQRIKFVKK